MSEYIRKFKYFCQKVLPLVYDDSLSYYEVLCKAIAKMNEIGSITNVNSSSIENLDERYADLEEKVEGLIENLVDVIEPWDSSIAYHIFTIVSWDGQNYIAIQDVPVGTMITNTDYWRPANTALEQINAIGQRVDDISEDVAVISTTVDNLTEIVERNDRWWYYPEDFGAAGDGTTDDTQAFQDMFDTVPENSLIVLKAPEYYIGSPITCNKGFLRITGWLKSEYTPRIIMGFTEGGPCITFTRPGISLSNFIMTRKIVTETGTLIYFDADNETADGNIDATLDNMCFYYCYTAVLARGRNVQIKDSLLSTSARAIHLIKTERDTDNRGYDIINNRFHYCQVCIYQQVNSTRTLKNGNIANNFCDGCNNFFTGYGDGFSIRNNYIDDTAKTTSSGLIALLAGSDPTLCVISGNIVRGNVQYTNYFINDQAGCITDVIGNDISDIQRSGITLSGVGHVKDNIVRNTANDYQGAYPIVFGATGTGYCCNNLLVDCSKAINRGSSSVVLMDNYPQ